MMLDINSKYNRIKNIPLKGKIIFNYELASYTWLKTGGKADIFFAPKDTNDLKFFLENLNKNIPFFILGAGSNTLFRDLGFNGAVIKLSKSFDYIKFINNKEFKVGAATNCIKMARFLAKNYTAGYEFFSGIPGSIGGAIKMNAGAYGFETSQYLIKIKILNRKNGEIKNILSKDYQMNYRYTNFPDEYIFLEGTFKYLRSKNTTDSLNKIKNLIKERQLPQPIQEKTSGSTFKNPKNFKAWKLIQDSGCKNYKLGKAHLSKMHSNFIINKGNATSNDIERLGEEIIKKVYEKFGVKLVWEIKIIGRKGIC
ncbi:MAG: UDP-N-acetylenolpyruvoylglucosamine reductase [Pelagibacterales bacterium]|nr:UDP-N-acetylenolpyruvoylglucosamine reductase [Pelagibacterales bacterium]OUU62049.1 MAG: UDP-N-acetylenolpyruvoylglucosamine reductase [Alphaproteobacteria bacterium TMED62]